MKNLKSVLTEYSKSSIKLGDSVEKNVLSEAEILSLKQDLKSVSSSNNVFLWMTAAMILIVFLGLAFLIYYYIKTPEKLSIIFGASGISIGGLITYMDKLRKEKSITDTISVLLVVMDKETIKAHITLLLNKM